jgi:uncharacterized membrane protein
MRGHRDLERASVAAILCALVAALVPWEIVRLVAALPLTLFLPGYAIVAAAFAKREPALPKRLVLSVAISLMVLVLSTFLLNIPSFGIRTASWAVWLPLVIVAACRAAALRRRPARRGAGRARPLPRPPLRSAVLVAAAILVGAAAVALAQKPLPAENAVGYTALWMLPTHKGEETLMVGVISNEQDPASYRLQVEVGEGAESQSQTHEVDLEPGEEETFEVDVSPAPEGRAHVVASLYREERPDHLYRRVTTWLPRQKTFP